MREQFARTELLIGKEGLLKLNNSRVAVFGIGGVGGYVCEALVRSGVGAFDLIDSDVVSQSNLNRQIIATHSTLGRPKVQVMKERMEDIRPDVSVRTFQTFFLPQNREDFPWEEYDYIVDAIDTVTAKIDLIECATQKQIPIISCMGAGNKMDATKFAVTDICKTTVCPLAKVMRRELKMRGIAHCKVVSSTEPPIKSATENRIGSIAFVPSVAGLLLAGEVVKDLIRLRYNSEPLL